MHDHLVRQLNAQHPVDADAHGVDRFGLRHSAGKTVEDKAVFAVVLGQALLDKRDDDLIRDQVSGGHIAFHLLAEVRAGADRDADNIARTDNGNSIAAADPLAMRALPASGRAE